MSSLFPSRRLRYTVMILVVLATSYFLYLVRQVMTPFAVAVVLAYLVFPVVHRIERIGIGRSYAILLVYLGAAAVAGAVFYYAVPAMVREVGAVGALIPHYVGQAEQMAHRVENMAFNADSIDQMVDEAVERGRSYLYGLFRRFLEAIFNFAHSILSIIFAPILAFYLTKDWEKIRDGFLDILPVSARQDTIKLGRDIDGVLKEFIKGHLLVAVLVGSMTGLGAALLKVKFALLIGMICAVAELFPYFGPILGAIPSVGLAYAQSPRLAAYVALIILVVQQVEASILSPRILGGKVGLHPLVVVFALLAGGELYGIWGMLLAVPVAAVIKILGSFFFYKVVE
ncbi:MAG TPA: AI-2E family transporter [Syntrophothermus lipocalidus]|nr:AI-2E family transporter [Syntrophothermus lipocalidus]